MSKNSLIILMPEDLEYEQRFLARRLNIPDNLARILVEAINTKLDRYFVAPTADPTLIELAKEYLSRAIFFNDRLYELVVFVPVGDYGNRRFFTLREKLPNGELVSLDEL